LISSTFLRGKGAFKAPLLWRFNGACSKRRTVAPVAVVATTVKTRSNPVLLAFNLCTI